MKYLSILILLISLSSADQDLVERRKKATTGHETQKKQFVNFINDDGEYTRNYVDLTNNEANGFDDIFRGRGNGNAMLDGNMQMNENQMGGLALDGDDMESTYGQMSGANNQLSQYGENPDDDQRGSTSTLQGGQPIPEGQEYTGYPSYNSPSFFGAFDVNAGSEDLLSPFYSSDGKLDDNINLSDTMSSPGHIDMATFNEALQGLNMGNGDKDPPMMKGPTKNKAMPSSDSLGTELGDMETADEKLQKLLESSITGTNSDTDDAPSAATVGSFLSALLSQGSLGSENNQHIQQQQAVAQDENPANVFEVSQPDQMQQNALNQLSGTISQNGMGSIQPVTVHVHASDKPGHKEDQPPPEASRAVAQQAQEIAMKQHKGKLAKLKKRLALLREKLTELEDEQAKKSTSNNSNDPKQVRNDAIKKLLIKNLRLAALIASKEIQLEEQKSRGLEYLTGKKEDGVMFDDTSSSSHTVSKFTKYKPLTELSKKAEDEVNHLSNTDRVRNTSTFSKIPIQNDTSRDTKLEVGKSTLNRINETLRALDNNSPTLNQRSILAATSQIFLDKLRKQIHSMSPDQVHAVEEKALATLFQAIKAKEDFVSKRGFVKRPLSKKTIIQKPPPVITSQVEDTSCVPRKEALVIHSEMEDP